MPPETPLVGDALVKKLERRLRATILRFDDLPLQRYNPESNAMENIWPQPKLVVKAADPTSADTVLVTLNFRSSGAHNAAKVVSSAFGGAHLKLVITFEVGDKASAAAAAAADVVLPSSRFELRSKAPSASKKRKGNAGDESLPPMAAIVEGAPCF